MAGQEIVFPQYSRSGFKINILELDMFVGCFLYVYTFFVPAILVGTGYLPARGVHRHAPMRHAGV